jgi:hypothetical protein
VSTYSAVHHRHAAPRFHVSSCSAAQCLVVAFICLSLVVGFIAQVLSGSAPATGRNLSEGPPIASLLIV